MEQKYLSQHFTVNSKRTAQRLAKFFNYHLLLTKVEPIGSERFDCNHTYDFERYGVLVINPNIDSTMFKDKCDRIYAKFIKETSNN